MAGIALYSPVDVLLGTVRGSGGGGALLCGVGAGMTGLEPGIGGTRLDRCADIFEFFGDVGDISVESARETCGRSAIST